MSIKIKLMRNRELNCLTPAEKRVYQAIRTKGESSIGDITTRLNITNATAREHLRKMVTKSVVKKVGAGKLTRYKRA